MAETYQKFLWDNPQSEHTEKIESILMDEINHSKELHNDNVTNQMRVGIIGLGRMGEGMSRRMIKEGIETVGYRRNYDQNKRTPREWGYYRGSRFSGNSCSGSQNKTPWQVRYLVSFNLSSQQN